MDYVKKVNELLQLPHDLCSQCGKCCYVTIFKEGLSFQQMQFIISHDPENYWAKEIEVFLSLFEPIENIEAKNISPAFVENLLSKPDINQNEQYFFKCKKLNLETMECSIYDKRPNYCRNYPTPAAGIIYHENCSYKDLGEKNWQEVLEIVQKLNDLQENLAKTKTKAAKEREEFQKVPYFNDTFPKQNPPYPDGLCKMCGMCCKLAYHKVPYEEMKKVAGEGEQWAKDFLFIFQPYNSLDEVRAIFPEYVQQVIEESEKLGEPEENVMLYHCRFIRDDGACGNYKNRPNVCQIHPSIRWPLLTKDCGYHGWIFELQEQAKKYIRGLKEYLYIKESLATNEWIENVPAEAILKLDVDDVPAWGRFRDYLDLINCKDAEGNDLPTMQVTREELISIIEEKTKFWKYLYIIS